MKRLSAAIAAATAVVSVTCFTPVSAQTAGKLINGTPLPFFVYHGFRAPGNHYIPSGWMGDYGDLRLDDHYKAPGERDTAIKISYNAKGAQGAGWAGIYWQNPANNWGDKAGGYNLNGAKVLKFRARGEKGTEAISEFKVGGIQGNFPDSGSAAIGPLTLSKKWQEFSIPLDGQELSSITGGFCLTMTRDANPDGATVYLDNIRFE